MKANNKQVRRNLFASMTIWVRMSPLLALLILCCTVSNGQNSVENHPTPVASSTEIICRIWHGWTTKLKASEFEKTLKEVGEELTKDKVKGLKGIQILRSDKMEEVEFTTIMWFDSIESVKAFAGEDYETAHIDERVRPLLLRYDAKSTHSIVKYSF